ncbi:MAG: 16S rRNA (cytosine(967)-C(5))-methyltransferase RsmB [Aeromonadales bacterium]|nr:16S rRNA (cytosine(967)-C(5))-methyltransferase RsmB [Aeromonadales bacterium]
MSETVYKSIATPSKKEGADKRTHFGYKRPANANKGKFSKFRKPASKGPNVAQGSASRAAAAFCVNAIEEGKSLTEALPMFTKELDDRDRALVQEIVYGTLRHRRLLSTTVNTLFDHSINQRFNVARTLILCAIYQLLFTRAPAHAVVAATVGACELCKCKNFTGMVNAVLRRFLREGAHLVHSADPCVEHSFPKWLYDELEKDYGAEKTLEIMKESNEHAPMFLRVENSKISTEEYKKSLEAFSINAFTIEQSPCTLLLEEPQGVDKLPFFDKGYIAVQDLAAQETAPLLELKDGDRVLDTCCAPGGKSAHILDICQNVKLVCSDVDAKRLESAKKNLLRLNRTPEFVLADVSEDTKQFEGTFDKILVDAPCSGTGVIRRHPDIKWLRRKKDIEKLIQTQEKILDNAFSLLNKGGILVYTTCSILKQENDEQIQKFLKRHSDAKLLPFTMNGKTVSTYQRLPGEDNADGFFYSRFIKE